MTQPVGYSGNILWIDLTQRTFELENRNELFWRRYAGGGLAATALLLERTPPGIDAFDPANLLIFASSVVAGHLLNAGLTIALAAAAAAITEHPSTAAIVTLTVTVGTWLVNFAAAVNGAYCGAASSSPGSP